MPGSWQPLQPPQPLLPHGNIQPCTACGASTEGTSRRGGIPSHCCHSPSVHTQMMERCGKASIKAICPLPLGEGGCRTSCVMQSTPGSQYFRWARGLHSVDRLVLAVSVGLGSRSSDGVEGPVVGPWQPWGTRGRQGAGRALWGCWCTLGALQQIFPQASSGAVFTGRGRLRWLRGGREWPRMEIRDGGGKLYKEKTFPSSWHRGGGRAAPSPSRLAPFPGKRWGCEKRRLRGGAAGAGPTGLNPPPPAPARVPWVGIIIIFFRLFKIGGTKPTRFPGNFVFIPPRPRPRGRALRPRYKGSGRRRHRDRDRTGPWPKVRARRHRGAPAPTRFRPRDPRSGARKAAAVPSPAAACGTERRCATHGAPRGAAGPGSCARTSARSEEAVLLQSRCAGRESSSEGVLGAPCGARTARTCPGAPGDRAALRAVTPPSERSGENRCHCAGLRFVLCAKTRGDEPGWPGRGAAAALHTCLLCPECSLQFLLRHSVSEVLAHTACVPWQHGAVLLLTEGEVTRTKPSLRSVPTAGPRMGLQLRTRTLCCSRLRPSDPAWGSVLLWKHSTLGQLFPSSAAQGRL